MKRRIGIDARLVAQTGVGVYTRNLIHNLYSIADSDTHIILYIRPEDEKEFKSLPKNFSITYSHAQWHTLREQTVFLRQIQADKLDLMHFCYFSFPIFYSGKFVITIHDLIPLQFPTGKASTKNPLFYKAKHFFYTRVLSQGIKKATTIFTPSHSVASDIASFFPRIPTEKIVTTYEGLDEKFGHTAEKSLSFELPSSYFLYVGNYYPHKNVEFLIKAFAEAGLKASLLLTGPSDHFSNRIDGLINNLGMDDTIIRMSHLSANERASLYSHALALVHPSKAEGFGLPLLEASHFGKPAIVSDIPVFRELLGDKGTYFNPSKKKDLMATLQHAEKNIQRLPIFSIPAEFSFKKMAERTYKEYLKSI